MNRFSAGSSLFINWRAGTKLPVRIGGETFGNVSTDRIHRIVRLLSQLESPFVARTIRELVRLSAECIRELPDDQFGEVRGASHAPMRSMDSAELLSRS